MQIPGSLDFLGGIFKFQVDFRFSRSPDYNENTLELIKKLNTCWKVQFNIPIIAHPCISCVGLHKFQDWSPILIYLALPEEVEQGLLVELELPAGVVVWLQMGVGASLGEPQLWECCPYFLGALFFNQPRWNLLGERQKVDLMSSCTKTKWGFFQLPLSSCEIHISSITCRMRPTRT